MAIDPDADGTTTDGGALDDGTTVTDPGTSSDSTAADSDSTGAVAACSAAPWFSSAWSARRRLDFDNTALAEDLDDFPVLLRLDDTRIDYNLTEAGGADLRIVAADHVTELPFEIEAWSPGGDSVVWLRVDIAAAGQTPGPVYLYYGSPGASDAQDGQGVWNGNFVSVHHLATLDDASEGGHDGFSATPPAVVPASVGLGADFDGVDDLVQLPVESDYDFTDTYSVSALVAVDAFALQWQAIVTKGDDAWRLHRQDETSFVGFGTDASGGNENLSGATSVDDGAWYHVAIVMNGLIKRIYVNGVLDGQELFGDVDTSDDPVMFGENATETGRWFDGRLDEVRISNVSRSPAWVAAEARSILDDDLVVYGAEELCDG